MGVNFEFSSDRKDSHMAGKVYAIIIQWYKNHAIPITIGEVIRVLI